MRHWLLSKAEPWTALAGPSQKSGSWPHCNTIENLRQYDWHSRWVSKKMSQHCDSSSVARTRAGLASLEGNSLDMSSIRILTFITRTGQWYHSFRNLWSAMKMQWKCNESFQILNWSWACNEPAKNTIIEFSEAKLPSQSTSKSSKRPVCIHRQNSMEPIHVITTPTTVRCKSVDYHFPPKKSLLNNCTHSTIAW